MRKISIAMIQMEVIFSETEKNIRKAEEMIKAAKEQGAQICVLPECMDLGWGNTDAWKLAEPIPGRTSDHYCRIAKEQQMYLVAGITERDGEELYNTALLISDEGEILFKHRKINVLTGVEDLYSIGDRIGVTKTKYGKIAIDICADNQVQSLSIGRTLARMGADMLLSPCAWAVQPDWDNTAEPYGETWHLPYKELSTVFRIPVVGVSNVGQVKKGVWAGWKAIGNSMAYDSDGSLITVLPFGEDAECLRIIEVSIAEHTLKGTALSQHLYNLEHRE